MKRSVGYLLILFVGNAPALAAEQSTTGWCSPIQSGNNNVFNCIGVDPRALKRLNDDLDARDQSLQKKITEANEWAKKYNELNASIEENKRKLESKGGIKI